MPMMFDITRKPANEDAVIRIYKYECRLNHRAAELLKIDDQHNKVRFTYDKETADRGHGIRVYVSRESSGSPKGYALQPRNQSVRIYSSSLCSALSKNLDGPGAYRICPEVSMDIDGKKYYEIFFRKYE